VRAACYKPFVRPVLPQVEDRAVEIVAYLRAPEARGTTVVVHGPPSAGKSLVLARVSQLLREAGDCEPVLLKPVSGHFDSAAQVLAQLGDQITEVRDGMADPKSPSIERAGRAREALGKRRCALLFDEPRLDPSGETDDILVGRARAGELGVAQHLTAPDGYVSVLACSSIPNFLRGRPYKPFEISTVPPSNWLLAKGVWGPLEDQARALHEACGLSEHLRSPLHLRLAVALVRMGEPVGLIAHQLQTATVTHLTTALASSLWNLAGYALRAAWAKLALARQPLPAQALDELRSRLDETGGAILDRALVYETGDGWVMHESVRGIPPAQGPSDHAAHARWYAALAPSSLSASVEAFYHWLSAGQPDKALETGAIEVAQLNGLGKWLSVEKRDYRAAADVFEQALRLDPDDDYAMHYLAYNLEKLGRERDRVEKLYRGALDRARDNVWWHQRYVRFLIGQARDRDARLAWLDAVAQTRQRGEPDNLRYFEHLHWAVANLLIHRGHLEWAAEILEQVPTRVRERSPDLGSIEDRLAGLREATEYGSVFPVGVPHHAWWTQPHLVPLTVRRPEGSQRLREWWAARVAAERQGRVFLVYGKKTRTEPAQYAAAWVTRGQLAKWLGQRNAEGLEVGRFLELGFYGSKKHPIVRAALHPRLAATAQTHGNGPDDATRDSLV
jgi:tetratricopeptide (TPR) repeat protein